MELTIRDMHRVCGSLLHYNELLDVILKGFKVFRALSRLEGHKFEVFPCEWTDGDVGGAIKHVSGKFNLTVRAFSVENNVMWYLGEQGCHFSYIRHFCDAHLRAFMSLVAADYVAIEGCRYVLTEEGRARRKEVVKVPSSHLLNLGREVHASLPEYCIPTFTTLERFGGLYVVLVGHYVEQHGWGRVKKGGVDPCIVSLYMNPDSRELYVSLVKEVNLMKHEWLIRYSNEEDVAPFLFSSSSSIRRRAKNALRVLRERRCDRWPQVFG